MNRTERRAAERERAKLPSPVVCIGIPSGPTWHAAFSLSLLGMAFDTLGQPTPGWGRVNLKYHNSQGSMLWKQRTDILNAAIAMDCTHVLFVDTDQTFPPNTLRRLLYHHKPVMACNVATKQMPSTPTARDKDLNFVYTRQDSRGLEQVRRIGTGIMLIDLAVLDKIEKPWFKVEWGDDSHQYGEDWWFCQQLEKANIPIFIDHELSWQVGHIGPFEYFHVHVPPEEERQAILKQMEEIDGTGISHVSQ